MKSLVVVCDLDSIVIDLLGPWLDWYNSKWKDSLTVDDLVQYDIHKIVNPDCGTQIYDFLHDSPERYRKLPPIQGAVASLKLLQDAGHDLILASAVLGDTAGEKFRWCHQNLPFLPTQNLMVGARKERIWGDIFIDDAPKNLLAYRACWSEATLMSIMYPYNRHMTAHVDVHADGYLDTGKAWSEIVKAIQDIAEYDEQNT
jgi:5'(3')-deoxyribonucleotidase